MRWRWVAEDLAIRCEREVWEHLVLEGDRQIRANRTEEGQE